MNYIRREAYSIASRHKLLTQSANVCLEINRARCHPDYCLWNRGFRSQKTHLRTIIPNGNAISPSTNEVAESVFSSKVGLRYMNTASNNAMNIFDRNTKRIQRNRTSSLPREALLGYDKLKEEIGYRVADRMSDVKRKFDVAVDLGCGRGHVSKHIYSDMVGTLYQCDMAEQVLHQSEISPEVPTFKVHCDEEFLPFTKNSLNLVVSSLSLHWVNDLPGVFKQIFEALKPDGCFLGAMFGGDTLFELRCALQLAETEREGGISPHISPFVRAQDLGGLFNAAGYSMLTIDNDEIKIFYPDMFSLMNNLKGMGESNCAWARRTGLQRETMHAASAIYKEMYGSEDVIPATYEIIYFIAWKPDKSQSKPAERGSGQVSMKDIGKLDKVTKGIEDLKAEQGGGMEQAIDNLAEGLNKLKLQTYVHGTKDDKS